MPHEDRPPREAIENGEVCGSCFGWLEPDEPVMLTRFAEYWHEPLGRYNETGGPLCGECARLSRLEHRYGEVWTHEYEISYYVKRPCATCGRPVFKRNEGNMPRYAACCDGCRKAYYNRVRRERRAARNTNKTCEVCGETFTATRADTKTCSPACKQKAYRRRRKEVAA